MTQAERLAKLTTPRKPDGALDREVWFRRYRQRFIDRAEVTAEQAQAISEAESFEVLSEQFEDDPEGAADEEMSYWEPE